MKALVLTALKSPLELKEQTVPRPKAGEVVVSIKAAALNRRDYWITQGMYPDIRTPVILGSDGAGIVSELGDGVAPQWHGREVVINPGWHWGDNDAAQSDSFRILGMPDDGTLSEQVVVPHEYLHSKPAHLNWHTAAALPLAGVTAYRAVFYQGRLRAGEKVLISGVGGGVATFALQFAIAAGAYVIVTSSSTEKIAKAMDLGARGGFCYRDDGWQKRAASDHGKMDLIIDSGGGDGYANLIDIAAPGARIVNYGATAGPPKVDLFKVFWKQLHLIGTSMGSPKDFESMLAMVAEHNIAPIVDRVYPFSEGNAALEEMKVAGQFGKLVLDVVP